MTVAEEDVFTGKFTLAIHFLIKIGVLFILLYVLILPNQYAGLGYRKGVGSEWVRGAKLKTKPVHGLGYRKGVGSEWVRGAKLKTKPVRWFGLGEKGLDRSGFGGQS